MRVLATRYSVVATGCTNCSISCTLLFCQTSARDYGQIEKFPNILNASADCQLCRLHPQSLIPTKSLLLFSIPCCLFAAQPRVLWVRGGGGLQPPRLTIFQAPKFSYGLCPSSYAHTMRGNGETKRKLYGLNVKGNEKFRQNSYEYSSSRAKPTSPSTTTPTKQTEIELTTRYFSYSIRLGNSRVFNVAQETSENIEFSIKINLILAIMYINIKYIN